MAIEWDQVLDLAKEKDPNNSFNRFQDEINPVIERYLPLKKLPKREVKNHFKPWITSGIRISIRRREKLYRKFTKAKDEAIKKGIINTRNTLINTKI